MTLRLEAVLALVALAVLAAAAATVGASSPPARRDQLTATPPPPIEPPGRWPTPSPTPRDESDPAAREILRRSDEAMNALRTARARVETFSREEPDEPAFLRAASAFVAPDRTHFVLEQFFGKEEGIRIGRTVWTRVDDGPWQREDLAFAWPRFDRLGEPGSEHRSAARSVRVLREEDLPSGPAWVVSYEFGA